MGTRGINGWVLAGKYYGQYNQFDTYPDGLGKDMVELATRITDVNGWEKFKENASKMQDIGFELDPEKDAELIKKYSAFFDSDVSTREKKDTYCLLRHLQGIELMAHIYEGDIVHYRDQMSFIIDSLFCEYAWFFNLDTMKFEGWEGFQKKKSAKNPFGTKKDENGYYPCKLVVNVSLTKIPANWAKKFVS